jgi:Bacterial Ig-like domain (group 2)
MIRKWFGVTALMVTAIALSSLSSCARSQKLVSLTVSPATATFGGIGAQIQFTAVGSYIHPPENKDVTQQATWTIDSQNLVTINGPGNVTAISDCGSGNVSASIHDGGNFVTGSAFVSAAGVGTGTCTTAALTAVVSGTGTVSSSPAGITCPGSCSAAFPLDSSVVLTGAPTAPATAVTWSWNVGAVGCASETTTTCTVALNTNATITATFQ